MGFKDQNWSHFGKENKTWREKRREEEEEEEEEKEGDQAKAWKLNLSMEIHGLLKL